MCEASPEQVCASRGKGVQQVMQAGLGQVAHMRLWGHTKPALLPDQVEGWSWILQAPEHAQHLHFIHIHSVPVQEHMQP